MLPWLGFFPLEVDDLPDFWTLLGGIFTKVAETATLTQIPVILQTLMTEGLVQSIHVEDNSTSYQNTTGNDAFATVTLKAFSSGTATRHAKIWSSPNDNSITGATLLYEVGTVDVAGLFDTAGDELTFVDCKIADNHFLVIENVDDSRAGTNNFVVSNQEIFFLDEYTDI